MAKKTTVVLIDDIDGSDADGTVEFGIDGQLYRIDLSTKHSTELYRFLEPYRTNGTRLGKMHVGKQRLAPVTPIRKPQAVNRGRNAAIREWCKAQGIDINGRGRIPDRIVAQYDAAHAG